jgi:hypothetical protein
MIPILAMVAADDLTAFATGSANIVIAVGLNNS